MIQCPWCYVWKLKDSRMRMQFCPDCSNTWDPVECNSLNGDAIKRPEEAVSK